MFSFTFLRSFDCPGLWMSQRISIIFQIQGFVNGGIRICPLKMTGFRAERSADAVVRRAQTTRSGCPDSRFLCSHSPTSPIVSGSRQSVTGSSRFSAGHVQSDCAWDRTSAQIPFFAGLSGLHKSQPDLVRNEQPPRTTWKSMCASVGTELIRLILRSRSFSMQTMEELPACHSAA